MSGLNFITTYPDDLLMMMADTLDNHLDYPRWHLTFTKKVQAILDLEPPTNLKQVRKVLDILQYYPDIWQQRSHILAPLTNLVGKGKKKFKCKRIHQESFKTMKRIVSKDVLLAYLDFNLPFEIHMDVNGRQLGVVIAQNG
eukprot:15353688-Ditylum_brightwellii.AAC.1